MASVSVLTTNKVGKSEPDILPFHILSLSRIWTTIVILASFAEYGCNDGIEAIFGVYRTSEAIKKIHGAPE